MAERAKKELVNQVDTVTGGQEKPENQAGANQISLQPQAEQQPQSTPPVQPAPPTSPPPKKKHTCCLALFIFFLIAGLMIGGFAVYVQRTTDKSNDSQKNRKVTYDIPTANLTVTKNYRAAGVFVYLDEEMPDQFLETLCNPDQTDSYSYYHTPYWLKNQAAHYGIYLNMEFKCLNKKIKVPDYFRAKTASYITCADGSKVKSHYDHYLEFVPWLRKTYPELSGYDYLVLTTYYGKDYNCPAHSSAAANIYQNTALIDIRKQYEPEEAKTLFGQSDRYADFIYEPPLNSQRYPMAFAHEFLHLIGAIDKYLSWDQKKQSAAACATDKKTGQMYEHEDIMCGGSSNDPRKAKVTEPTAREVGWGK